MSDLKLQLKQQIIEVLSLEEISPESIVDSEPLFGDGLGLDSIDALELWYPTFFPCRGQTSLCFHRHHGRLHPTTPH